MDLPEGPRVQARLLGGPAAFAIGAPVRLALEAVGTDDAGDELVVYRFAPIPPVDADPAAPDKALGADEDDESDEDDEAPDEAAA